VTRRMVDSTNVHNIPLDVDIAGVYRNGSGAADPAVVARRFPQDKYVTVWIDVLGTAADSCQIVDVEPGNVRAEHAPRWIKARRAAVHTSLPTVYCDRTRHPEVVQACEAEGLKAGQHYQFWIATLDGSTKMNGVELDTIPGVVAVQVEGGQSAAFDRSVVYNDRWHPSPQP
jgi:hypothetical protein